MYKIHYIQKISKITDNWSHQIERMGTAPCFFFFFFFLASLTHRRSTFEISVLLPCATKASNKKIKANNELSKQVLSFKREIYLYVTKEQK